MRVHPVEAPRRELLTVAELAERYRLPKPTAYEYLRRHPEAGVLKFGRKVLVDAAEFDRHVTEAQ